MLGRAMATSAQPDNRSAERSPERVNTRGKRGGNRGRKPALHRIHKDAGDRTELWSKGEAAKARHRDPNVPARIQVARLTDSLVDHYRDLRVEQVGDMEPGKPGRVERYC